MFWITPTLRVEGQPKFKTWWGAFFSLVAIAAFGYYAYLKSLFFLYNHAVFMTEKMVVQSQETELGNLVQSFDQYDIKFELELEKNTMADMTPDVRLKEAKEFLKWVNVEVQRIEVDPVTEARLVTSKIVKVDAALNSAGVPSVLIDPKEIAFRGRHDQVHLNAAFNSTKPVPPTVSTHLVIRPNLDYMLEVAQRDFNN